MHNRTKHIITSRIRRAIRWEFWPMSVFYIPIVAYIVFLTIRFRGLTFLSVNPGLPMSGLIGERKAKSLLSLTDSPFLARFELIEENDSVDRRVELAQAVMQRLDTDFPVVLKPDFGQRGADVAVIRSVDEMHAYLTNTTTSVLVQEYIKGEEFGVFYMRYPVDDKSEIYSITEKTFPVVYGDGVSTLEMLMMSNPRTHFMAEYLLDLHAEKLDNVLEKGEAFKVVEIGSHCRGSVFLDGNHYISQELSDEIDKISRQIDGFHFGRYDIRVESSDLLRAGKDFKILEVNGVTSESTNVYDPKNSVIDAYKILFRQWRAAFEIGKQTIKLGADKVTISQLIGHLKKTYG